jgi:hypothetical protein
MILKKILILDDYKPKPYCTSRPSLPGHFWDFMLYLKSFIFLDGCDINKKIDYSRSQAEGV